MCNKEILKNLPPKFFRGSVDPYGIGYWVAFTYDVAKIYGLVHTFSTSHRLKIVDISNPKVVLFLRNIFIKYVTETNSNITVNVFDTVIKSKPDGETERNSSFEGDTWVLKSLLYAREKGWLSKDIDGFGSDKELSTDSMYTKHHPECCLFEPEKVLGQPILIENKQDPKRKRDLAYLKMERFHSTNKKRKNSDDCKEPVNDCKEPVEDCEEPVDDCKEPDEDCEEPVDDCEEPVDDCEEPSVKKRLF